MNKKWFIGLLSLACVIFVCFCYLQVVTPVKITIGLFAVLVTTGVFQKRTAILL